MKLCVCNETVCVETVSYEEINLPNSRLCIVSRAVNWVELLEPKSAKCTGSRKQSELTKIDDSDFVVRSSGIDYKIFGRVEAAMELKELGYFDFINFNRA